MEYIRQWWMLQRKMKQGNGDHWKGTATFDSQESVTKNTRRRQAYWTETLPTSGTRIPVTLGPVPTASRWGEGLISLLETVFSTSSGLEVGRKLLFCSPFFKEILFILHILLYIFKADDELLIFFKFFFQLWKYANTFTRDLEHADELLILKNHSLANSKYILWALFFNMHKHFIFFVSQLLDLSQNVMTIGKISLTSQELQWRD